MESTKKFMNICIAVSIVLCSLSLLIWSVKDNRAIAAPSPAPAPPASSDYLPVGVVTYFTKFAVIGYNPKDGSIKALGTIGAGEIKASLKEEDK